MGIVQLDSDFPGERVEAVVMLEVAMDNVPDSAGDKKILLLKPQFTANRYCVGGIEDLGNLFPRRFSRPPP